MAELRERMGDRARVAEIRENVWRQRDLFTMDHHADRLIAFFHKVIAEREL